MAESSQNALGNSAPSSAGRSPLMNRARLAFAVVESSAVQASRYWSKLLFSPSDGAMAKANARSQQACVDTYQVLVGVPNSTILNCTRNHPMKCWTARRPFRRLRRKGHGASAPSTATLMNFARLRKNVPIIQWLTKSGLALDNDSHHLSDCDSPTSRTRRQILPRPRRTEPLNQRRFGSLRRETFRQPVPPPPSPVRNHAVALRSVAPSPGSPPSPPISSPRGRSARDRRSSNPCWPTPTPR